MESSDLTVWKSLEVERFQIIFFEISHRDFLSCNGNEPLSESIITMTKEFYKMEIYIWFFSKIDEHILPIITCKDRIQETWIKSNLSLGKQSCFLLYVYWIEWRLIDVIDFKNKIIIVRKHTL